jgi:hypothetical protein
MGEIVTVQLKAKVPQALKRQTFSLLALRGLKFSTWVRAQMEVLVADQHGDVSQAARPRVMPAEGGETA